MKELKDILRTVPEVEGLVGHEDAGKLMTMKEYDGGSEVKSTLQSAFAKLMTASKDMVSEAISKLISRLNIESKVKIFLDLNCCELLQFFVTSVIVTTIYFIIYWRLLAYLSCSGSSFMMHLLFLDSRAMKRSLGTIFLNDQKVVQEVLSLPVQRLHFYTSLELSNYTDCEIVKTKTKHTGP